MTTDAAMRGIAAQLRQVATPRPQAVRVAMLRLVLAHGIEFEAVPWSTWKAEYEYGPENQCTRNAWKLVKGSESTAFYCEAFAWQAALAVEHAWAVTEDGRVIDPTWRESVAYPLS